MVFGTWEVGGVDDDSIRLGDSFSKEKMVRMRPSVEVGISSVGLKYSPTRLEYCTHLGQC